MICSICKQPVTDKRTEFGLWYHDDGSIMCEDAEAIEQIKVKSFDEIVDSDDLRY